ncbi:MAG TPA: cation transporter [Peptococcaceae bacterium]|nr:cation transporter [Peptococcaceae bacterium]
MFSKFLVKTFIPNHTQTDCPEVRKKYGYLSGTVGIVVNVLLFGLKLATGLIINSIALIGDALNNLSDAASSLVTLAGFKLAGKPADKEHPFGHGRIEYIAGLIVSFLIILVGYELLKSSVERIIHPVPVNFSLPVLFTIVVAILLKGWLFFLNRMIGKRINSHALLAAGIDSLSDMVATGCIGLALLASLFTAFPLDGYVGVLVSLLILYSGISLTKETVSPLLGEVPEKELIAKISQTIRRYEKVLGIHDLIVHTYGPGHYMASIHVEVSSKEDIMEIHEYIDRIEHQIQEELGILLTIHMDPLNLDSRELRQIQEEMKPILHNFPIVIGMHDFRIVGKGERKNLLFDVVVADKTNKEEEAKLAQAINRQVQEIHPYYNCIINFDYNDMLIERGTID